MHEAEARRIANQAAQGAIEGLFLHLGIDIKDKDALKELRSNLSFLQRMSKGANIFTATCIGAFASGFIGLMVFAAQQWMSRR